jgi:membrane protein YqaA with SNARE-associated domain
MTPPLTRCTTERISRNSRPVIGFGQAETLMAPTVASTPSLWTTAILTSVVGGATSWVVEEIAKKVRGKRR